MRLKFLSISTLLFTTIFFYQNCSETSFQKSATPEALPQQAKQLGVDYTPQDQTVFVGGSARFDVGVSGGDEVISYEWYKDGSFINEEEANFDIFDAQLPDAGDYSVDVFANGELYERFSARLTVLLCQAGSTKTCSAGGKDGVMTCSEDGMSYGACDTGEVNLEPKTVKKDPCAGFKKPGAKSYTRPGTYTYTVPNCVKKIRVTAVGGGGGGSRSKKRCAFHHYSGSGGGGVIAEVNVKPGQKIRFTVGKGGRKGHAGIKCYKQGEKGGTSSFGGYITAYGGGGGGNRHYKENIRRPSSGGSYKTSNARRIKVAKGQSKGLSGGCGGRSGLGGKGSCSAGSRAGIGGGGYGSGRQYQNSNASDGGDGMIKIEVR